MSVIGIDLGTTSSSASIFKNNLVELLHVEQTNRKMPSCVAFAGNERLLGTRALTQITSNPENTIYDVKTMIGLTYAEAETEKFIHHWPFSLQDSDGKPKIVVQCKERQQTFYPEEIAAMILSRIWEMAKKRIGRELSGAVITVPASFNHAQRKATIDAAKIAKVPVLGLINEPTAAALAYLHESAIETQRKMLVLHFGGGAFNASVIICDKQNLKVVASVGRSAFGGRDFDDQLFNHLATEFSKKEGYDVTIDSKATSKLHMACQTAKKNLSVTNKVRVSVKALYKGIDFQSSISREEFWNLNMNLLRTIILTTNRALEDAELKTSQIDDVLAVGNSIRLSFILGTLVERCGLDQRKIRQTIKPDEAAVSGAALMASRLWEEQNSRTKVSNHFIDVLPYAVIMETNDGCKLDIFSRGICFLFQEAITLHQKLNFFTVKLISSEPCLRIADTKHTWEEELRPMTKFTISCGSNSGFDEISFTINNNGKIKIACDPKVGFAVDENCGLTTEQIKQLIADAELYSLEEENRSKIKNELYKLETEVYKTQDEYGCKLSELIQWIETSSDPSLDEIKTNRAELEKFKKQQRLAKAKFTATSLPYEREKKDTRQMSQLISLFQTLGILNTATGKRSLSGYEDQEGDQESRKAEQTTDISQQQLDALCKKARELIIKLQKENSEIPKILNERQILQVKVSEKDTLLEEKDEKIRMLESELQKSQKNRSEKFAHPEEKQKPSKKNHSEKVAHPEEKQKPSKPKDQKSSSRWKFGARTSSGSEIAATSSGHDSLAKF